MTKLLVTVVDSYEGMVRAASQDFVHGEYRELDSSFSHELIDHPHLQVQCPYCGEPYQVKKNKPCPHCGARLELT